MQCRGMAERRMTYEQVVETIINSRRFGRYSGVEVMAGMLKALGDPQKGMRLIHIAGTNGKGSVSAFLCEILREAGLCVGVFTSPHLMDFRERICVDGRMIEREAVERLGRELLVRRFSKEPSMFDICLAMALLYFREQQCDVVILETGLGGSLDATNAVGVPEVSVITKIGYDHMEILGNTLEEIAEQKAGIIKKGTDVVLESQTTEVLAVLLDAAERAGARACHVIAPEEFLQRCYQDGTQSFVYGDYGKLQMRMLGLHQYENAAAAAVAAEQFLKNGKFSERIEAQITGEDKNDRIKAFIRNGIFKTRWQGRMELLRSEPFFMVDGAHNSSGIEALRESLACLFPGERFHFMMGVMADKDYESMVELLLPLAAEFTAVGVQTERALGADALAAFIRTKGIPVVSAANLAAGMERAECAAHKTIAVGSLYFIGEIEAIFKKTL